jgi:dTDP-4-amino-4,6-dideoxygalactose transaminase
LSKLTLHGYLLDLWLDCRQRNADRYRELFAEAGGMDVVLPAEERKRRHIYNQFVIRTAAATR